SLRRAVLRHVVMSDAAQSLHRSSASYQPSWLSRRIERAAARAFAEQTNARSHSCCSAIVTSSPSSTTARRGTLPTPRALRPPTRAGRPCPVPRSAIVVLEPARQPSHGLDGGTRRAV